MRCDTKSRVPWQNRAPILNARLNIFCERADAVLCARMHYPATVEGLGMWRCVRGETLIINAIVENHLGLAEFPRTHTDSRFIIKCAECAIFLRVAMADTIWRLYLQRQRSLLFIPFVGAGGGWGLVRTQPNMYAHRSLASAARRQNARQYAPVSMYECAVLAAG